MNLLFITGEFSGVSSKSGGIGTYLDNIVNAYLSQGHNVTVLVYGMEKDLFYVKNGISFYLIKNIRVYGLSWLLLRFKLAFLISRISKTQKIDIIEVPDWCGISAFLPISIPIVLKCHGSDTFFCHLEKRKVKWMNYYLEHRAFVKADAVVSVSGFCGHMSKKIFNSNREITIINNGIKIFETTNAVYENTTVKNVLYFGTIIRKKGVLELAAIFNLVFNHYPETNFILIGSDSTDLLTGSHSTFKVFYDLCSDKLKQRINYLGKKSHQQLLDYISCADVCVFPSFAEAFPMSWLEAMCMGKPIVASNIGWASELIDHDVDGYLVDPNNHKLFADSILSLFDNNQKGLEMGQAARKKVLHKFDIELIALQQIRMFSNLIKHNN